MRGNSMSDLTAERVLPIPPVISINFPAVAGFWRRFFAFFIDSMILGIVGQLIGLILSNPLYELGPYAKPFGLLFILPYFGILNSKLGHGQTLGKKILGIAVRNENNQPISLWRSLFRIALLQLPVFLNGFPFPKFGSFDLSIISSVFVFGFGGAILYTMVFNRGARQGLHDLILSTYVVNLKSEPKDKFPCSAKIHWIISGIWFGIVIISVGVISFINLSRISSIPFDSMTQANSSLANYPEVLTTGINDKTTTMNGVIKKRTLVVSLWVKGKYNEKESIINLPKYAEVVFSNFNDIDIYDGLTIYIINGFNLGIASVSINHNMSDNIENWRALINTQ
ncbi:MAG: hypothetical protein C0410_13145 [Anaerolinea sp.]|nr:hypothetical protein [Anaerolinea sp.]